MIRKIMATLTVLAALVFAPLPAHASSVTASLASAGQVVTSVQTEHAAAEARPARVMVVRGDTLSAISARWCGSARHFASLAAASGIGNFDLIYPGQWVTLDCAATVRAPAKVRPVVVVATRATRPAVAVAAAPAGAGAVVAYALAQVGKGYVWGAAGPSVFDCSGLVVAAYARIGIRLPHQSEQLLGYGRPVARADLRPGDVIWPEHGHVVIYIGGGRIVEAADPRQGVRTNTVYAFMTARRYL